MPAEKFFESLDLDQICRFLDGHQYKKWSVLQIINIDGRKTPFIQPAKASWQERFASKNDQRFGFSYWKISVERQSLTSGNCHRVTNRVRKRFGRREIRVHILPIHPLLRSGTGFGYFFFEAYPSAYHPPPLSSKLHAEIIFLAFSWHLGHSIDSVSIRTSSSVIWPHLH
jgi:hypothetical protein